MSALLNYWPTIEEINNCIKAEAEASDESLILAVHQPMIMEKIDLRNHNQEECNERKLLDYFLSKNLSEGFILVPITGKSGMGKSHAIRWLNSQITQINQDKKNYYIVKIPKSSSLRDVVKRIIDPLKNTEEYQSIYKDFENATNEGSDNESVINFRGGLESALNEYDKLIENKIKMNTGLESKQDLWIKSGLCKKLPSLFSDYALKLYFDQILLRIVKRSSKGKNINDTEELFCEDDFLIPEEINILDEEGNNSVHKLNIDETSVGIKQFYYTNMQTPEARKKIVDILNVITDNAIKKTFKLHENLGGKTLQDIILDIRRYLLSQGKELILLIEDFAALTGIQDTLLKICIQAAYEDGQQKYCIMRTAVALTDGYLSGRDTIETRAQYKWEVKSSLDNDLFIFNQVRNLIGSYLNAARLGKDKIKLMFDSHKIDIKNSNSYNWMKVYRYENIDESSELIVDNFGVSEHNYPLFPYNNQCIDYLIRNNLKVGDKINYNPRTIINTILRDFLIYNRDSFIENNFPKFDNINVKTDIEPIIDKKIHKDERSKYKSFITLWGGNPETEEELKSINPLLYKAFNLTPLIEFRELSLTTNLNIKDGNIKTYINDEVKDKTRYEEKLIEDSWKEWKDKLNKWIDGESLSQVDSSEIRKYIADSILNYINWPTWYMRKQEINIKQIWIPGVKTGNPPDSQIFIRISDNIKEPLLRNSILSVIRFVKNDHTFNYPEGPDDILYFTSFIKKLAKQVCLQLRKENNEDIKSLAQVLSHSNLILGSKYSQINKNNISGLFLSNPTKPTKVNIHYSWNKDQKDKIEKWNNLRENYYKTYSKFREFLFDRHSCFQGTGTNVLAINHFILKNSIKDIELLDYPNKDNMSSHINNEIKRDPILKDLSINLNKLTINSIITSAQVLIGIFIEWREKLVSFLGEDFDKSLLNETLKNMILSAKKEGNIWPKNIDDKELNSLRSEFMKISVKDMIDSAKSLEENDNFKIISIANKFDSNTYEISLNFINAFENFLQNIENNLDNRISQLQENNPAPVKHSIKDILENLDSNVAFLEKI